ncbi:antibiotic biosynthesis monooxygenase family protein [Paracoccus halophilus]|nr:antibiotic biosynthesis monooxygenase family protein [Paracoccus halophilus]
MPSSKAKTNLTGPESEHSKIHIERFIMSLLKSLDEKFPLERQLGIAAAPVVLINLFALDAADESGFLDAWTDDAHFMKQQPGFISTQLHRAIGDSPTYLNYAVWDSTEAFRAAFTHPEFVAKLSAYPSSAVASPHLFRKVAVSGICAA